MNIRTKDENEENEEIDKKTDNKRSSIDYGNNNWDKRFPTARFSVGELNNNLKTKENNQNTNIFNF